ncbi:MULTISPECIES: TetR/AcrR family transcriptional regulator [Enterococcus]|uniref:TetR/AcrR family transcriptional regulator n=1 Tax=Enterococcus TaxID=1350 RepID=UPI0008B98FA0|nr:MULTISPECIES: TetR/AcrR family transcriptional regulator [Enterococcus]BBM19086.1 TetR family transcriptional regulator [Enterococcus avium]SES82780.1 transcriptional regulator, TetR family [Enterococcus malodoratus]HCM85958.1 TetR/AcrR family transcriptional regulator [Enterococcus sp.]
MDRRKRKTQKNITAVFYQLLKKKSYEEISVSQICQVADINRGTFYLHFIDKDDLLEKSISHEMQELVEYCEGNGETSNQLKLEKTFEYITEHREELRRLLGADKQGFFAQFQIEYLMEQMTDQSPLTSIFFAHGLVGLLEYYLMNDISEVEISEELEKLTYSFR